MEHVKFVSYDGKYPNLCTGTLVLNIDGTDYSFGFTTVPGMSKCDFPMFWHSGGSVSFDNDWVVGKLTIWTCLSNFANMRTKLTKFLMIMFLMAVAVDVSKKYQ